MEALESRKTIFGNESVNYCGYCKRHNGVITPKQIKDKGCLNKQCWHLIKYDDHPFWKEREKMKQLRKERKEKLMG